MDNEKLIDFAFSIAGKHLRENITDWNDLNKWRESVFELNKPIQAAYLIGVLNIQVMNGGFIQYYDNNYGIFARETANILKKINADSTFSLLKQSIQIVEKHKAPKTDFITFIGDDSYFDIEEIETIWDNLATEYYKLDNEENLTELLANYLRKHGIN